MSSSRTIQPTVNARSMGKALYAGQSVGIYGPGDYKFDRNNGGIVWEANEVSGGNSQKSTSLGKWLCELAEICAVELEPAAISDIAFHIGILVGEEQRA